VPLEVARADRPEITFSLVQRDRVALPSRSLGAGPTRGGERSCSTVFVTGSSGGTETSGDYLTIAFGS